MSRSALEIIGEAQGLLVTAQFGLEDMRLRPGRAKTGLRNAVVFGRNTTWALQNLRGVVPDFDEWYNVKQREMREDPLMLFFRDLRTSIEKKAHTPTSTSAHIRSFSSGDMARFEPRPPGATEFFIGDQNGGSGWNVTKPDGSKETYYVELPSDIGEVQLNLPEAPVIEGERNTNAIELVQAYLAKLQTLINEARERFT